MAAVGWMQRRRDLTIASFSGNLYLSFGWGFFILNQRLDSYFNFPSPRALAKNLFTAHSEVPVRDFEFMKSHVYIGIFGLL